MIIGHLIEDIPIAYEEPLNSEKGKKLGVHNRLSTLRTL